MKGIKKSSILILAVLISFFTSCLTEEEKVERTYEIEMAELDEFLNKRINDGYDIDTTTNGVYYIVYEEGEGEYPAEGDELTISYTGYFLDAAVFDSSFNYYIDGKWTFSYLDPEISLIPGLSEGLSIMKKGAVIDMILPSNLAYGSTGSGVVPPYTSLIFSVTLHNIVPATE